MKLLRLLRTARFLHFRQIAARLTLNLKPVRLGQVVGVRSNVASGRWILPAARPPSMHSPTKLNVLNQNVDVVEPGRWNDQSLDKLSLYHIHYFDDLNASASSERSEWHKQIIHKWITENPPPLGNGWEAYPLSLRICNWVKWQLRGNQLSDAAIENLYLQARVLSQRIEYHLQGNHVFANAKALCFAGAFYRGTEAEKWLEQGLSILGSEIKEQVLDDGGHFELSPMYHSLILEDILDIHNLATAYQLQLPFHVEPVVSRMLNWLTAMVHPDGGIPYFNDSTDGIAPRLDDLAAYAGRLSITWRRPILDEFTMLEDSGYVRFQNDAVVIIADVGEIGPAYQPGHGHCDCLSFEASVFGERVIVNTGISTYNNCIQRHKERATSSHNTVSVEGVEQSEVWSAFRVGRRAFPIEVRHRNRSIEAAHNGFAHLGIIHRRRFGFSRHVVQIDDRLDAVKETKRTGIAHFHFHPEVEIDVEGHTVRFLGGVLSFSNALSVTSARYEYCLGFNRTRHANVVNVKFSGRLVSTLTVFGTERE